MLNDIIYIIGILATTFSVMIPRLIGLLLFENVTPEVMKDRQI